MKLKMKAALCYPHLPALRRRTIAALWRGRPYALMDCSEESRVIMSKTENQEEADTPAQDTKNLSMLDPEEDQMTTDVQLLEKAASELYERFERQLNTVHTTTALQRERIGQSFRHLYQYLLMEEQVRLGKNKDREQKAIADLQGKISLLSNLSSSIATMLFQLETNELAIQDAKQLGVFRAQLEDLSKFKVTPHDYACPFHIQEWRGIRHVVKPFKKSLTLDPTSAHGHLVLSKNLKQVRFSSLQQPVKSKNCFEPGLFVLGVPGFHFGQHYWEVDIGHKSNWIVGVVKESVAKKEAQDLVPAKGFWVLNKQGDDAYTACGLLSPNSMLSPLRIGVFVDVSGGHLAFYDVDTTNLIFEVSGCQFEEKLFPLFCPGVPVHAEDFGPLTLIG